ncbi:uncharacterized protein LOC111622436 [Centruroides sculpturatus]|uniref:uncharacterized protein LOC111622436 n=1 Tax=Centruroides sculpturatus TaxID=218467 RepID=UPI000C6D8ECC|nr:uncharacterized protein LOC111622436 [Centruroides sculpturatus]
MDTIYRQIFTPIITYACGSWSKAVPKVHIRRKLIAAQRRALIYITRAYSTTPNLSLQILARKPPIDKYIMSSASLWHLKRGRNINMDDLIINSRDLESSIPLASSRHPALPITINFYQPNHADLEIYTDGSKADLNVGLGAHFTILQAELFAISRAVAWSSANYSNSTVAIISDSLSSITLLQNHSHHPIAYDIQNNISASNNSYYIRWTRAHQGTLGNERADALAKSASSDHDLPVAYNKLSIHSIKLILKDHLLTSWQRDRNERRHPTTHRLIPAIRNFINSKWYCPNQRMSQFLTNHGGFHSYLARFHNTPNPNCSLCGVVDSSSHYLFECPALELERLHLKIVLEAHGKSWPNDCYEIFKHKDTYEAFNTLIVKYFKCSTVPM